MRDPDEDKWTEPSPKGKKRRGGVGMDGWGTDT